MSGIGGLAAEVGRIKHGFVGSTCKLRPASTASPPSSPCGAWLGAGVVAFRLLCLGLSLNIERFDLCGCESWSERVVLALFACDTTSPPFVKPHLAPHWCVIWV